MRNRYRLTLTYGPIYLQRALWQTSQMNATETNERKHRKWTTFFPWNYWYIRAHYWLEYWSDGKATVKSASWVDTADIFPTPLCLVIKHMCLNREEHCWTLFVLSFGGNDFIYRACTKKQLVSFAIVPIGEMCAPFSHSLSFVWNMCNCATQLDCSCGLIKIDKIGNHSPIVR